MSDRLGDVLLRQAGIGSVTGPRRLHMASFVVGVGVGAALALALTAALTAAIAVML